MPSSEIKSPNFWFLAEQDETLVAHGVRAEAFVFNQPNISLTKARQLGELLAKHSAAIHGLDPTGEEFRKLTQMLWKKQIIPREIRDHFDNVRLLGNEAAHDNLDDTHSALRGLISAHTIAVWFHRTFADSPKELGPFRPPPNPEEAEAALRDELGSLRQDAVRFEQDLAEARGNIDELEGIRHGLESEISKQYLKVLTTEFRLNATEEQLKTERDEFEKRLQSVSRNAKSKSPEAIQSLIDRSAKAANLIGHTHFATHLPLGQMRIVSPRKSSCHESPMVLAQTDDGFVEMFCTTCGISQTLKEYQFKNELDLWLDCPNCSVRMRPARVQIFLDGNRKDRYGFRCDDCYWRCLLTSLLPQAEDLSFPYDLQ